MTDRKAENYYVCRETVLVFPQRPRVGDVVTGIYMVEGAQVRDFRRDRILLCHAKDSMERWHNYRVGVVDD